MTDWQLAVVFVSVVIAAGSATVTAHMAERSAKALERIERFLRERH